MEEIKAGRRGRERRGKEEDQLKKAATDEQTNDSNGNQKRKESRMNEHCVDVVVAAAGDVVLSSRQKEKGEGDLRYF